MIKIVLIPWVNVKINLSDIESPIYEHRVVTIFRDYILYFRIIGITVLNVYARNRTSK